MKKIVYIIFTFLVIIVSIYSIIARGESVGQWGSGIESIPATFLFLIWTILTLEIIFRKVIANTFLRTAIIVACLLVLMLVYGRATSIFSYRLGYGKFPEYWRCFFSLNINKCTSEYFEKKTD